MWRQEQLLAVRDASMATKAEIKKLEKKLWRHSRHGGTDNSKISFFSKQVVLVLFALAGNATVATEYLYRYKKRYHKAAVSKYELTPVVEQWVIDLPQESYNTLLFPVSEAQVRAVQTARQFFAEHSTAMWIEHNNEQKSVAPCTFSAMSKFDDELVGPERVLNDMYYDMRQDTRLIRHRTFAWRFRQRWRIGLKPLKERGVVPLPQRRNKVTFFFHEEVVFWL